MPQRHLIAPLGLSALVLLSACGGSGTPSGSPAVPSGAATPDTRSVKAGGEMVAALAEDPDALDPTLGRSLVGREVFANMCEKLYDIDSKLNIVPQLASALPTTSPDGKTVTIKVRQGLTFNDGTDLDAAAVKTSLDRDLTLQGSGRKSELSSVSAVAVVDPTTVQLTLSKPYAPLTGVLADRSGMIMSPAQLAKLGANFGQEPVCVGPFSFVSRQAGNQIVLKKSTLLLRRRQGQARRDHLPGHHRRQRAAGQRPLGRRAGGRAGRADRHLRGHRRHRAAAGDG